MGREQRKGRRLRGARASDDRGAALVEAAIILPFLVLMVFGIVELGFLFRSATVVNTSTRSGARLVAGQYASATSVAGQRNVMDNAAVTVEKDLKSRGGSDTPDELWIYQADTDGFPLKQGNFGSCTDPCFKYKFNTSTGHFQYQGGSWTAPAVCGSTHDSVGVYVKLIHAPIGFTNFLGDLTVNEKTVMRLEPPNPNSCPAGF